jgi:hypothetical protein
MVVIVGISADFVEKAKDFAIRKQPWSYPRLNETKEEQHQRLFIGKLGELIGQESLKQIHIPHNCVDKLKVVEEMSHKDVADCIISPNVSKQLTVDFKSAWQEFHKGILVPEDQYARQRKDIYIGIKLYCTDRKPVPTFPNFESRAEVHGWVKKEELRPPDECPFRLQYPAYWVYLKEMHQLELLLKLCSLKSNFGGEIF